MHEKYLCLNCTLSYKIIKLDEVREVGSAKPGKTNWVWPFDCPSNDHILPPNYFVSLPLEFFFKKNCFILTWNFSKTKNTFCDTYDFKRLDDLKQIFWIPLSVISPRYTKNIHLFPHFFDASKYFLKFTPTVPTSLVLKSSMLFFQRWKCSTPFVYPRKRISTLRVRFITPWRHGNILFSFCHSGPTSQAL